MKKKRILWSMLFWGCILASIGLFAYPLVTAWKAGKEKLELLAIIREHIEENSNKIRIEEEPCNAKRAVIEVEDHDDATDADGSVETISDSRASGSELVGEQRKTAISSILSAQTVIGIIEIPQIGVVEPIVEGTTKENLKAAAGHVKGTAHLGEEGNSVICGHNGGLYGRLFQDLKKLNLGDEVIVTDSANRCLRYQVYDSFLVAPEEVWVLEKDENAPANEILTLFTCEKNGTMRRIIRCKP